MKAKITSACVALGIAASVTVACASSAGAAPDREPNARVFHVTVDGRSIPCILVDPPKAAIALSCDWTAR